MEATISGHVVEAGSITALAGALVQTTPSTQSTTTDSRGGYEIRNPAPGAYIVQAGLTGYTTATSQIVVRDGEHVTADLQLQKIVPVVAVVLSSSSTTIALGQTLSVTATVRDASGNTLAGRAIQWTTSNTAAVSLSSTTGATVTLTANASGTSTVRATCDGIVGSMDVTVPTPASVSLSSGSTTIALGQAMSVTATVRDGSGVTLAGRAIQWTTSNAAAVSLSSTTGATVTLTAVASGTSTVRATCEGVVGSMDVSVPAPAGVAAVTLTAAVTSLLVGDSVQMTATPRDANGQPLANRTVTWTTSNATVASIRGSGATAVAVGIAAGSATITASSEAANGSVTLTVSESGTASTVTITPPPSLQVGDSLQLVANVLNSSGHAVTRPITWSSDNAGVASVSSSGLVRGVAAGNTQIRASADGKSGVAALSVVNPAPVVTSISPDTVLVGAGATVVTVNGRGFLRTSTVTFGGVAKVTTFLDATKLQFTLSTSDLSAAGSIPVAVTTPAPGGGVSSQIYLIIKAGLGTITNGETITGVIATPGDLVTKTFYANKGSTVVVSAGKTVASATLNPWVRLVSPTGTILGDSYDRSAAQVTATATADGTYTVILGSKNYDYFLTLDGTGAYSLTVAVSPGVFVVSAGDEGGPMTNGASHAGSITTGDVDQWSFTATQGATIAVSVGKVDTSATLNPWVRLVSPTGTILGDSYDRSAAQITVTAPASGTYTVIVGSKNYDYSLTLGGTGAYSLTIAVSPGAFVVSAGDEGGPMTNGASHAGSITTGDIDLWSFTATQAATIILSLGKVDANATLNPWIRLVSPTGTILGDSYDRSAAQITVTAPASGTYTVIVGSKNYDYSLTFAGTGAYLVRLTRAP